MSSEPETMQTPNIRLMEKIQKGCSTVFPCVGWLCNYSKMDAIADLIAGITIGLIIIPQSVAYVAIINLNAKIGLLSSIIGGIVYAVFGTVKEISIGPTAMMSLLTDQYTSDMVKDSIGTFCFGCSIVGFALSVLRLGLIVEFISLPVSSAFGSVVGLTILAAELRNLTGLCYKSNKFVESLEKFVINVREIKIWDISLGIICTTLLIFMDKVQSAPIPKSWKHRNAWKKFLWLIVMSKNAIVLLFSCILTKYYNENYGKVPFELSDSVDPGLPEFQIPWMPTNYTNSTTSFNERVHLLYDGMIITPVVGLLVHLTIAKFFDSGQTVRINYELLSLSICNFWCSFFNSAPVAGAFSRSAVSKMCQVKTPLSSIYAGVVAYLALTLLTPYFKFIPRATLSAVIITAIFSVIDYKIVIFLWKKSKKDFFVLVCTLITGLYFGIEVGLIIGVVVNLIFLVYLWARPSIEFSEISTGTGNKYALVVPDLGLFYPAVCYLETQMYETLAKDPYKNLPIAVNCIFFKGVDYTAIKGLTRIIETYRKEMRPIVFYNANSNIFTLCAAIDRAAISQFCDGDDFHKHLFFGDRKELVHITDAKEGNIQSEKTTNGNCSLPNTSQIEEHEPLLDLSVLPRETIALLSIKKGAVRPISHIFNNT